MVWATGRDVRGAGWRVQVVVSGARIVMAPNKLKNCICRQGKEWNEAQRKKNEEEDE